MVSAPSLVLWPHCDQTVPFRQDRYFNYLTGAHDLPSAAVLYFPETDKLVLYLPPVDKDDVMWSGLPLPEQALKVYDVDEVKYFESIPKDVGSHPIVTIDERNKETITKLVSSESTYIKISSVFLEALDEARLRKDSYEVMLMKKAAKITDVSHLSVMSALPIEQTEGHIHAEFVYHPCARAPSFKVTTPFAALAPTVALYTMFAMTKI